jgi:hypothetical protein
MAKIEHIRVTSLSDAENTVLRIWALSLTFVVFNGQ